MFGWKLCSKFNFIAICPILANFATFLGHAKEDADVSKKMSNSRIIFTVRNYMPEAISTQNLIALPVASQELSRGGGLLAYQIAQPL